MELSPATDCAIRELLLLAAFPTRRSGDEISVRLGIPESNVIAVSERLMRAGWIHKAGAERSRYQLAVSLKEISMLSVIQVMEDGINFNGRKDAQENRHNAPQPQAFDCLEKSRELVQDVLGKLTLDQFADRNDLKLRPYPRVGLRLSMRNKYRTIAAGDGKPK